jgi:anti-sigma-K factor RskA
VDRKAYIESGILEAYAMGFASVEEVREVENNLRLYPELQEELERIQEALNAHAISNAKQPPADLKARIQASLFNDTTTQIPARKNFIMQYRIAAVIALLAIAGNLLLFMQWKETSKRLVALESQNSQYAGQIEALKASYQSASGQLAFIADPRVRKIEMKPVGKLTALPATLYYNSSEGTLLARVNDLPAAPAGKQYQLWAIVEGKPVDLGLYIPGGNLQEMKKILSPQAFAVTLEKEGGSAVPTMDQMVVMGEV